MDTDAAKKLYIALGLALAAVVAGAFLLRNLDGQRASDSRPSTEKSELSK